MSLTTLLSIIQIIVAVSIVGVTLLQVRGSGTTLFGQGESTFRTRRGIEKMLFRGTIGLGLVFVVLAVWTARLGT